MNNLFFKLLTIICLTLLIGCASTYRPINPPSLNFSSHDLHQDGIKLSYKYDILREKGNKKYANKAEKKNIKLIGIKITNNTDSIINIGKDVIFYSGNYYTGQNQIFPLEPMAIKESIKQIVPGFFPYILLTFVKLTFTEYSNGLPTSQDVYPIGIILGPAITLGNTIMASSANKNMLSELYEYNLINKDIEKGETVYGIIGVRDMGYDRVSIKMVE